jgi:hypothetical protein
LNADPDPATQTNADPDPKPCLLPWLRICLHYIRTDPDPTLIKKFRSDYRIQIPGLRASVANPDPPDPHVLGHLDPDLDLLVRAFYL